LIFHQKTHRYEKVIIPGKETTRAYVDKAVVYSHKEPRTHYLLAITIRPDSIVRGRISLSLDNPKTRQWEIGWTVHPDYWGNGYATEAATRMLTFAFEKRAWFIESISEPETPLQFRVNHPLCQTRVDSRPKRVRLGSNDRTN
jgi:hypothetical protein